MPGLGRELYTDDVFKNGHISAPNSATEFIVKEKRKERGGVERGKNSIQTDGETEEKENTETTIKL